MWRVSRHGVVMSLNFPPDSETAIARSDAPSHNRQKHKEKWRTDQNIINKHIEKAVATRSKFAHTPVPVLRQHSDIAAWVRDQYVGLSSLV